MFLVEKPNLYFMENINPSELHVLEVPGGPQVDQRISRAVSLVTQQVEIGQPRLLSDYEIEYIDSLTKKVGEEVEEAKNIFNKDAQKLEKTSKRLSFFVLVALVIAITVTTLAVIYLEKYVFVFIFAFAALSPLLLLVQNSITPLHFSLDESKKRYALLKALQEALRTDDFKKFILQQEGALQKEELINKLLAKKTRFYKQISQKQKAVKEIEN